MKKLNLPSLEELSTDEGLKAWENENELNKLLNSQPPKEWIKKHPVIKRDVIDFNGKKIQVPYEYIPIERVEYLLRRIFGDFKIEVLREGQLFNSAYTTVRVHYMSLEGEWRFHDGVGAFDIQTIKGASTANKTLIVKGSVSMALPLSKTLAIKDACDLFGNLFGANLNRDDNVLAGVLTKTETQEKILKSLFDENMFQLPVDLVKQIEKVIEEKDVRSYSKAITQIQKNT